MYALDVATGAVLWVGLAESFFDDSPAVGGGLVFG